jgi:hypothetical protein
MSVRMVVPLGKERPIERVPWLRVYRIEKSISLHGNSLIYTVEGRRIKEGVSMATVKDGNDFREFRARQLDCACFSTDEERVITSGVIL